MRKIIIIMLMLLSVPANAKRLKLEKEYQKEWCERNNGVTEYSLPDRTRVDCLTNDYAVEVEFAENWAEAIGQALYYAHETGRRPGIVLIIENDSDNKFLERLNKVNEAYKLHIKIWIFR
jgi:hypothetical protein